MQKEILSILENDSRTTIPQLALMLNADENEVAAAVKKLEDEKIILGYRTLVNWEKTDKSWIKAYIELKITPQRGEGFDKIAERIYKYPQVKSLTLMSGAYDLLLEVEDKTLQDVARFVSEKLAQMDSVVSTATHFVLKTYKKENVLFENQEEDMREVITL
ncbi:MAG: Lrp/AsnC family transcriptional regulator [Clostridia bacterium]|nr:Lrp/AsnC family transcriptional regulator [Clostridia bacterium]